MFRIEIIGTIDNQRHYDIETIKELLILDSKMLMLGRDFVGRPGTRIHACDNNVIKIRSELNFDKEQSRRWIQQALEKERQLGVHHPHKTWLLITEQKDTETVENISIANITPRLKPLHIELKNAPDSEQTRQYYLALLMAVFRIYLTLAKQKHYKLDEGLSNFAVSPEGIIYYLDDEYYQWDKFVSFSMMLGVYVRTFDWIDEEFIDELGHSLVTLLIDIFRDRHCCIVIARQLQSLFMPQGKKEHLLQQLIQIFTQNKTHKPITHAQQTPSRFFALLADVHANYAALDTVLNYLDAQGINQGIILGDIVGYNAEPKECIERLQRTDLHIIKGNHDHAVATNDIGIGFSNVTKIAMYWTVEQLSQEHRNWLKALPEFLETDEWLAVHGAPMDPEFFNGYVYLMTYEDNLTYMQDKQIRLCFHGHSHIPGIFARDKLGMDHCLEESKIALPIYKHLLICPGSVGQPRNGSIDTQFAIYDREQQEVTFLSLPYDVEATVQKMRDQNFPETLWKRLLNGK